MSQLDSRVFTATMASGATTSTEVDLGRTYRKVYIKIPASSVGNTRVYGASTKSGTAVRVAAADGTAHDIASSVSNQMVQLDVYPRYLTVVASTAPANGASYEIVCTE